MLHHTLLEMRRALVLCLLLSPVLAGCRYNFVPLIPGQTAKFTLPARITQANLTREGERLSLSATLEGTFDPDYLQVQWFNNSTPLGSDSVYLDSKLRQARFELDAPEPGAYRAVLLLGGKVLRQVEFYEVNP